MQWEGISTCQRYGKKKSSHSIKKNYWKRRSLFLLDMHKEVGSPWELLVASLQPCGIRQTLKKAEGREGEKERNWGPGYITERLVQALPGVHPDYWTFQLVSQ